MHLTAAEVLERTSVEQPDAFAEQNGRITICKRAKAPECLWLTVIL